MRHIDAQCQILLRLIPVTPSTTSIAAGTWQASTILFCRLCPPRQTASRLPTAPVQQTAPHAALWNLCRIPRRGTIASASRDLAACRAPSQHSSVTRFRSPDAAKPRVTSAVSSGIGRRTSSTCSASSGMRTARSASASDAKCVSPTAEQHRFPNNSSASALPSILPRSKTEPGMCNAIHSVISRDTVQENCSYITHRRVPFPSTAQHLARRSIFIFHYTITFSKNHPNQEISAPLRDWF